MLSFRRFFDLLYLSDLFLRQKRRRLIIEHLLIRAQTIISLYGLNLVAALLIFLIGRWAAKLVRRVLDHVMTKRNVDSPCRILLPT